jgi:succinylglutamate desuccinylase
VPFIFCRQDPRHFALARLFSTPYIVSHNLKIRNYELRSSTDNYVDRRGGVGLTFETGWHKDLGSFNDVMDRVMLFLSHIKSLDPKKSAHLSVGSDPKFLSIYHQLISRTKKFQFEKEYINFNIINKGELIAMDDRKKIKAARKSYIIFPKKDIVVGKAVGYLAVKLINPSTKYDSTLEKN